MSNAIASGTSTAITCQPYHRRASTSEMTTAPSGCAEGAASCASVSPAVAVTATDASTKDHREDSMATLDAWFVLRVYRTTARVGTRAGSLPRSHGLVYISTRG